MITATYHNMLNFVNKLFGNFGSSNLKKYENIVKDNLVTTIVEELILKLNLFK